MDAIFGIAGLVTVAAITPGPNNFAILQIAATQGGRSAGASIVGVVAGGLVMIAICYAGLAAVLTTKSHAGLWIAVIGSLYLAWLAARLIFSTHIAAANQKINSEKALPCGLQGLFAFQFVNPKAWLLVLTATSIVQSADAGWPGLASLVLVFSVVPTLCLLIWSWFGLLVSSILSSEQAKTYLDRTMGLLLAISVYLLWR